jgi:hypothetical protein
VVEARSRTAVAARPECGALQRLGGPHEASPARDLEDLLAVLGRGRIEVTEHDDALDIVFDSRNDVTKGDELLCADRPAV